MAKGVKKPSDLPCASGMTDDMEINEILPVLNKDEQNSFPADLDVGTQPKMTQMEEIVAKEHQKLFDLPIMSGAMDDEPLTVENKVDQNSSLDSVNVKRQQKVGEVMVNESAKHPHLYISINCKDVSYHM